MRTINQAGLDLLTSCEGLRLKAYQDVVGVWTIGYGNTGPDVVEGLTITEADANFRLWNALTKFEAGVLNLITDSLTDNEFSALVCFAYNVGLGALQNSSIRRLINQGDHETAANHLLLYNKAGTPPRVIPALVNRRSLERALFLTEGS